MAATDLGSSPEPDVPILVSQTSSDQTISLGDKSRGLPGLLTPETSSHGSGWRERNSLRGEVRKIVSFVLEMVDSVIILFDNNCR